MFSEPFDEITESVNGLDNIGAVNWTTTCPSCIDADDFFKVTTGALIAQDSNGPATWQTSSIDISSSTFFNISLVLKEEGNMEACATGCTSADWVQLEYNIDNTGWQTPSNSVFCSGGCADINIIQSDDIAGTSLNYSTDCIPSGASLEIRISAQAWAENERWIIDDIEVSTATGPIIDAGIDQTICGNNSVTLTASNPQNGILTWNNSVIDGVAFTLPLGNNTYVASTNLNGCIATDTVLVSLNAEPTFILAGTNPTTCNGTDGFITLSGLNPITTYDVSYNTALLTIGPSSLISDINGSLIISNLSSDTYTNFLIDLLGCSALNTSIINLIDPSAPSISAGVNQIVCLDENVTLTAVNINNATLSWNNGITDGVAFTPILGLTTYTVTAYSNGCSANSSVDVTVTPNPTFTISSSNPTTCGGSDGSITLSGLNATINYDLSYTTSNTIGPNTFTTDVNGDILISNLSSDSYTNFTIDLGACSALNTTLINLVNPSFPIVSAGNTQNICEGESVTLTAINTSSATITWNGGVQDGVPFIPNIGTTPYTVTADLNGCIATSQVDVVVNPNPTFVISSSNPTSCIGTEGYITFSGLNNAIPYTISYTNGTSQTPLNITSDMAGQIILTGLGSGNYTTFSVDISGCTSTDNTIINLTDPPPPSINAGLDQSICYGDSVILSANNANGSIITWNNGVFDGVEFQPVTDMTYVATTTLNNCTNTDTVSVFVITGATINAGPDQNICYGDSTLLHATITNGIDFVWTHDIIDSTKFIPESTTIYTVTSSVGSCAGSDAIKIIVNTLPNASFTFNPNTPTVENTEVIFTIDYLNPAIETYDWNFGDSELSNLESPTHLYPIVGGITYDVSLLITDTAGCKDSSSARITIDDIVIYYVPNAFTPDGDNINNTFQPVFTSGFDPQEYHLIIFNHWGEVVFETYNSDIGWDGQYDDSQFIQQGVYVWVIEFGDLVSDKKYNVKGMITLIK